MFNNNFVFWTSLSFEIPNIVFVQTTRSQTSRREVSDVKGPREQRSRPGTFHPQITTEVKVWSWYFGKIFVVLWEEERRWGFGVINLHHPRQSCLRIPPSLYSQETEWRSFLWRVGSHGWVRCVIVLYLYVTKRGDYTTLRNTVRRPYLPLGSHVTDHLHIIHHLRHQR